LSVGPCSMYSVLLSFFTDEVQREPLFQSQAKSPAMCGKLVNASHEVDMTKGPIVGVVGVWSKTLA
jgi:hypothetical protein